MANCTDRGGIKLVMGFETEPIVVEYDHGRFNRAPVLIDRVIRRRLSYLGEYMVQWMAQHGPRDTSLHVESLRYDINSFGEGAYELVISSTAPNSAAALQTGRGPGLPPPFSVILGWVQRRGLSAEQTKSVRTVGKNIGQSYRKRKNARSVSKRISSATTQFGEADSATKKSAYRVMSKIARYGTTSKPFLFTEVVDATRANFVGTLVAIEADIAAGV